MVRIVVIGIGVGLLVAALVAAMGVRAFRKTAAVADATVVGLNAGGSHPQIEFVVPSGQKVSVPQGGFIWGLQPGQKVRVLYAAGRPAESARLDSFGSLWFVPLLLGFIGAAFLVTGFSLSRSSRRRRGRLVLTARSG